MKVFKPNKIIYQDRNIIKILIESVKYGNFEFIIDVEDYDKIKNFRWNVKHNKKMFYVFTRVRKNNFDSSILLHRIILGVDNPKIQIDHKDHDGMNNKKNNLRKCSASQNQCNVYIRSNNKSGYKGVSWCNEANKWRANITHQYNRFHLGLFSNKIDAALAYNKAAIKYHKEFAVLNNV